MEDVKGIPLFNTGEVWTCSFRHWGSLMYQAYHPEGTDARGYCRWAWSHPVLPGEETTCEYAYFAKEI